MPLLPLPVIPTPGLARDFVIDDVKIEITSLDIASHGGFLIAGCSNGVILFFDVTDLHSQRNGTFLTQIRPKGMHTTFRLNVKITEDSRACFAGVLKGSSEMVAIDLSSYQLNWGKYRDLSVKNKQKGYVSPAPAVFDCSSLHQIAFFNYSDAKLRGFGSAACVSHKSDSTTDEPKLRKYYLACGMGIKNVHVWQVAINDSLTVEELMTRKRDEWTCIYDVASNGMTITHLGFRNAGQELISKSAGMNIRVWDLSKYSPSEPVTKPPYEDIANTHDVKCIIENSSFTYGGTYEFAVINVDKAIPKEANRDVLELPVSVPSTAVSNDDAQSRRRRMMREVDEVIGTQDGTHVLILCTDGGVVYYKHPTKEEENRDGNEDDTACMKEVPALGSTDPDDHFTWTLRRIGQQGMVVLLRAYCRLDKTPRPEPVPAGTIPPMSNGVSNQAKSGVSIISVCSLVDLVPKDTRHLLATSCLPTTSNSNTNTEESVLQWHGSGTFYQEDLPVFEKKDSMTAPLSLMTPSAVIPSFDSNPSTGAGLSTPRHPSSFLDSFHAMRGDNNSNNNSEVKRLTGIAAETPSSQGEEGPGSSEVISRSSSGLPPTASKKRKTSSSNDLTALGGIETPQVSSTHYSQTKKVQKTGMKSPGAERSTKSNATGGKRSVEAKLFTSEEKRLNKSRYDNDWDRNDDEEEEDEEYVNRLVTSTSGSEVFSPVRRTKASSHKREQYDPPVLPLIPEVVLLTEPAPTVEKIMVSEKILPLVLTEESTKLSLFQEKLQQWEQQIFLKQEYSKHVLPAIETATTTNTSPYRDLYHQYNEKFYKEQRRVFYSIVYELKQFFLQHREELFEEEEDKAKRASFWQQKYQVQVQQLQQNLIQDVLSRQKSEWKGCQLQWSISCTNPEDRGFLAKVSTTLPQFVFQSVFMLTRDCLQQQ